MNRGWLEGDGGFSRRRLVAAGEVRPAQFAEWPT